MPLKMVDSATRKQNDQTNRVGNSTHNNVPSEAFDPCLSPERAARYFDVSWQHFKAEIIPALNIKDNGKPGKLRRFRLSELNRALRIWFGECGPNGEPF